MTIGLTTSDSVYGGCRHGEAGTGRHGEPGDGALPQPSPRGEEALPYRDQEDAEIQHADAEEVQAAVRAVRENDGCVATFLPQGGGWSVLCVTLVGPTGLSDVLYTRVVDADAAVLPDDLLTLSSCAPCRPAGQA